MLMLLQVLAGGLLLLGSGLIFFALLAVERPPRPHTRPVARPTPDERDLPRAA